MRKKDRKSMWLYVVLGILAGLSLVYFLSIQFFTGYGSLFHFGWLFLSIGLAGIMLMYKMEIVYKIPIWIRRSGLLCVIIGLVGFAFVECLILSGFVQKKQTNVDYLIVLGAQLKTSGPSRVLKYRLDKAIDYLNENPNTMVIVSGGQGSNEPDTEANGMKTYLIEHGIDEIRIIKEDASTNTFENLKFSKRFLNPREDSVGIVSNDFHVFRATKIAKKAGYQNVCGIPAKSYLPLQLNNMTREALAVVKDWLVGNL